MWLSFVHFIKMCLIEYWHFGGGSSLRMKEWDSRMCPLRSRIRVVSSLLVLLGSSFLSFKMGCIWENLLWGFSSRNCCHFFGYYLFDFRFEVSIWNFNVFYRESCWLQLYLMSRLYHCPEFRYGLESRKISTFCNGSVSWVCWRSWQLADFPIWCIWEIEELRWGLSGW